MFCFCKNTELALFIPHFPAATTLTPNTLEGTRTGLTNLRHSDLPRRQLAFSPLLQRLSATPGEAFQAAKILFLAPLECSFLVTKVEQDVRRIMRLDALDGVRFATCRRYGCYLEDKAFVACVNNLV